MRLQYRLSTVLILMLFSAIWLGLNFYPSLHNSLFVSKGRIGSYVSVSIEEHWIYGWPCGIRVEYVQSLRTPWRTPVLPREVEMFYGIEKDKTLRTYFLPTIASGVFSYKALGVNLGLYGLSMLLLYWLLERKRRPAKPCYSTK